MNSGSLRTRSWLFSQRLCVSVEHDAFFAAFDPFSIDWNWKINVPRLASYIISSLQLQSLFFYCFTMRSGNVINKFQPYANVECMIDVNIDCDIIINVPDLIIGLIFLIMRWVFECFVSRLLWERPPHYVSHWKCRTNREWKSANGCWLCNNARLHCCWL